MVLGVTFAFGLIGFYDDYLKLVVGNSQGPRSRAGSISGSRCAASPRRSSLYLHGDRRRRRPRCSCRSSRSSPLPLAAFGFIALAYFMIVGMSNAVNLTDGLDGLAIMPAALVGCRARRVRVRERQRRSSRSTWRSRAIPHAGELLIFCAALAGAGPRLPVVQLLSRAGVHGRHRRARASARRSASSR